MIRENILPSSLSEIPHIAAFDNMYEDRLAEVIKKLSLVYLVDLAPIEVLEILAVQYNMTGYNGWFLATTIEQKRDLIRRAVSIKRTIGTPFAIREAARALGIKGEIEIIEGVGALRNGTILRDGSHLHVNNEWATFIININKFLNPNFSQSRLNDFAKMIEEYKPARSRLGGINLT